MPISKADANSNPRFPVRMQELQLGFGQLLCPGLPQEQLCLGPQAPRSRARTEGGIQIIQIMALQVDLLAEIMELDHNEPETTAIPSPLQPSYRNYYPVFVLP